MKIIKKGKIPITFIRFCCGNCGCIFECEKGEYTYDLMRDKSIQRYNFERRKQ